MGVEPTTLMEMLFVLRAKVESVEPDISLELLERIIVRAKELQDWADEVAS